MNTRLQILQLGHGYARHEWHDIGLKNYKNLTRWYLDIANREAVVKGYDLLKDGSEIPKP